VVLADHDCPLCGNREVAVWMSEPDIGLIAPDLGSSRRNVSPGSILRCRECGLGFRRIRPEPEELARLYRQLDSRVYESESRGRERTARRCLKIVQRYRTSGRLLDVGCASGAFLQAAADAGWKVVGVEPSPVLCDKAEAAVAGRGDVIRGTLEDADLPPASFDVVTLWDVLEHVADPVNFLRLCGSLSRPGGHLFVNVPDLDSLPARLFKKRWPLLLPEHLRYFDRRSLRLCGEQAAWTWLRFGRRPASFSAAYVLYRLGQHGVPGTALAGRVMRQLRLEDLTFAVPLGELYGVWRR
jgi:SAM-dependent methyltransferase